VLRGEKSIFLLQPTGGKIKMFSKNIFRKALAFCLLVAVSGVFSLTALAQNSGRQNNNASITVTGTVSVNDRAVVSNSTIASGSTITTGTSGDSVAVVDIVKLGRIELLSQSSAVLKFDDGGINITLLVGKVRVMNMPGIMSTVATKEGMVMGDNSRANTYTVESECGKTTVQTKSGLATLRADSQDKQVAAGSEAVAGSLNQTGCTPCMRPDPNATFPTARFFPFLLPILIGTGVVAGVIAGTRGGSVETGGGGIVVSTFR
jgi:hypothetical protein